MRGLKMKSKTTKKILYYSIIISLYVPAKITQWLDNIFNSIDNWTYELWKEI